MQRNLTCPHIPNEDCEATLIHPSTISLPNQACEQRLLNLEPYLLNTFTLEQ